MRALHLSSIAATLALLAGHSGAAVTLSGTVRDFCAPGIGTSCTALTDFEGPVPGVVPGMVAATLSGGLPTPGPSIVAGGSTAANFAKWYVDSPGFNVAAPLSITLVEGPVGTHGFSSSLFFPIDGLLLGNQGRGHNYHFTLHLEGKLSFDDPTAAADRLFSFSGDDDLWVFVDGKLMMDLGGVHGAASDTFTEEDLKAAGLLAGVGYDLDIFFAERHTIDSTFSITTTLALAPPGRVPEPAAPALLGLGLLALLRHQRRPTRR